VLAAFASSWVVIWHALDRSLTEVFVQFSLSVYSPNSFSLSKSNNYPWTHEWWNNGEMMWQELSLDTWQEEFQVFSLVLIYNTGWICFF
jgi:hypothetical protein